jgi:uncharacterized membrane-anchored protein
MQARNVPTLGSRYWLAISLASVFGANLGDFLSHDLHLGHWRGLAPLGMVLATILLAERRERSAREAYYWCAVVIVRAAATNLADLATHDFKLIYPTVIGVLAGLLAALVLADRARTGAAESAPASLNALPVTDGLYWASMLSAGTLGTGLGDALSEYVGLGAGLASSVLVPVIAALFVLRALPRFGSKGYYWAMIVGVRTIGTCVGDFLAETLGLEASTFLTGLTLVAALAWTKKPDGASFAQGPGVQNGDIRPPAADRVPIALVEDRAAAKRDDIATPPVADGSSA